MHIKFTLLTTSLFLLIPQAQATTWSYSSASLRNAPAVLVYSEGVDSEQARFDDIKYDNLRQATDLKGKQEEYFYSDRSTEDDEFFYWVTDGRTMLWRGQRVINPPTTPSIDIASFRVYDRFAVDKYSVYFDGKRVASNLGSQHIDLATLKMNAGRNSTTLTDNNTLYLKGLPQGFGSAHNVVWLGEKSWDACGQIAANLENKPSDVLIRFANHIYLNGEPLNADANSFQVVRWIPNSLLTYRDKNGTTRHIFGGRKGKTVDCEAAFIVGETDVRWQKTGRREEQAEVLPGVDPEHFRLLTNNVAQYRDRLYVDKLSFFGEKQLETITLDSPDLVMNSRLSAGKSHGYFIRQSGMFRCLPPPERCIFATTRQIMTIATCIPGAVTSFIVVPAVAHRSPGLTQMQREIQNSLSLTSVLKIQVRMAYEKAAPGVYRLFVAGNTAGSRSRISLPAAG